MHARREKLEELSILRQKLPLVHAFQASRGSNSKRQEGWISKVEGVIEGRRAVEGGQGTRQELFGM